VSKETMDESSKNIFLTELFIVQLISKDKRIQRRMQHNNFEKKKRKVISESISTG
jgi:hypothetical protein